MSFKGRRVFVTGATGFIGSALARRLLREGAEVHALVRASSSPARLGADWARLVRHVGDIEDPASVAAALAAARPEIVFHLARERDGAGFERQAKATRALAKALKAGAPELKRWVRTAHSAPSRRLDEELTAEAAALGLPVVTLELFLVYGPGQGPGDFPRSLIDGEAPASLSASLKDFVFIDDVVEAYLLAALRSGVEGRTIPIGTGQGRSEADAAEVLLRMTGSRRTPPRADGDAGGHPADPTDARRLLGWVPRVLLEQGLARLLAAGPVRRPDAALERRQMIPWLGASGPGSKPARNPPAPWSLIASAAAHFQNGDLAAAGKDADAFIAREPAAAAGPAMKALLAAQRGDRAETERWLEAAGPRGPEGWALALRGMMRARWGADDSARRDLDATRLSERSAWAYAARAEVNNRAGLYRRALSNLEAMRRLLPGSPEPDSRAAEIHLEQAQYVEAAACLARAAKLAPKDPALRRQRSRVFFVEGDLPSARREIEAACRLAPDDRGLREELLRLRVLLDEHDAVEAMLKEPWAPGTADYWRAYVLCRRARYAESVRLFAAAEAACGDERLAAKCAFYRHVVGVLAQAPAAPLPKGRELFIMGMGFRHPYQVSVEVLWTLRGCQEFFSNLSDSTVVDLLGLYGVPMRTIVFRQSDGQSTACARIVMRGLTRLRRAGVVTRGQPVYYGRLAHRLVQDCARKGIDCRVPPSVSIADFLPSMVGLVPERTRGLQVRDSADMDRLDPRLPLVLYNFISGPRRIEQCRTLQRLYAAATPVWLMPGSGQFEYRPTRTTVGELEPALMRADPAVTLFFPGA